MTDKNTLADYNIKDFDKPSRYVLDNHKVGSYPCFLKEQAKEHLAGFESKISCSDKVCIECTNDHFDHFRGNFEDATTLIDLLPELFPEIFKENRSL